jgi:hypothetical protein
MERTSVLPTFVVGLFNLVEPPPGQLVEIGEAVASAFVEGFSRLGVATVLPVTVGGAQIGKLYHRLNKGEPESTSAVSGGQVARRSGSNQFASDDQVRRRIASVIIGAVGAVILWSSLQIVTVSSRS